MAAVCVAIFCIFVKNVGGNLLQSRGTHKKIFHFLCGFGH